MLGETPSAHPTERTIWGRRDGVNVIKVMWCLGELGLADDYRRIDWGGPFGGNDDPAYRAINPMGRLPTLQHPDGFTLWESNSIIRYLCATHSEGELWPSDPAARAQAEKWMDWSISGFQAATRPILLELGRHWPNGDPKAPGVPEAIEKSRSLIGVLDDALAKTPYLGGDRFTMGDIPVGAAVNRWMKLVPDRPAFPHVDAWYEKLCSRPAYRRHCLDVVAW